MNDFKDTEEAGFSKWLALIFSKEGWPYWVMGAVIVGVAIYLAVSGAFGYQPVEDSPKTEQIEEDSLNHLK